MASKALYQMPDRIKEPLHDLAYDVVQGGLSEVVVQTNVMLAIIVLSFQVDGGFTADVEVRYRGPAYPATRYYPAEMIQYYDKPRKFETRRIAQLYQEIYALGFDLNEWTHP